MLDMSKATEYLEQLQRASAGIIEAFKNQSLNVAVASLLVQSGWYYTDIYNHRRTIGIKKNLKSFLPNG
jgi:hypothetical protein